MLNERKLALNSYICKMYIDLGIKIVHVPWLEKGIILISKRKHLSQHITNCRYLKLVDSFKRVWAVGKSFFKIVAVGYPELR